VLRPDFVILSAVTNSLLAALRIPTDFGCRFMGQHFTCDDVSTLDYCRGNNGCSCS